MPCQLSTSKCNIVCGLLKWHELSRSFADSVCSRLVPPTAQGLSTRLMWQQVAELRAERERLLNDKTSLHSQIAELREH